MPDCLAEMRSMVTGSMAVDCVAAGAWPEVRPSTCPIVEGGGVGRRGMERRGGFLGSVVVVVGVVAAAVAGWGDLLRHVMRTHDKMCCSVSVMWSEQRPEHTRVWPIQWRRCWKAVSATATAMTS